jgi:hypothetical protein
MQPIKAIAIVLSAITVGMQNPVAAVVNNQASQANLVLVTTKQLTTKQPVLVAINDTYWGPQGDFKISMPGEVTENTSEQLTSVSTTQTVYTVIHRDFPEASGIPIPQIRQVLQSAMRETIGGTGKVIRSTNLVIDGYPGLELLMQHSDGSLGQYRAFVVNQRLYFMGALTPDELTTEAVNFFDSFQVYPEQISYSR